MSAFESKAGERRCPGCGSVFRCGIAAAEPCWCTRLPPLAAQRLQDGAGCYCEACLRVMTRGAPAARASDAP